MPCVTSADSVTHIVTPTKFSELSPMEALVNVSEPPPALCCFAAGVANLVIPNGGAPNPEINRRPVDCLDRLGRIGSTPSALAAVCRNSHCVKAAC
jgi:hypothetical protein